MIIQDDHEIPHEVSLISGSTKVMFHKKMLKRLELLTTCSFNSSRARIGSTRKCRKCLKGSREVARTWELLRSKRKRRIHDFA